MKPQTLIAHIGLVIILMVSGGCTVGPDYVKPEISEITPETYKELAGWKLAQPQIAASNQNWWEIYQDPLLNRLVEQVSISNLTVAVAEARFRQARALVQSARSGRYPSLGGGAAATRTRVSENPGPGGTFSTLQLPLDFSWELDLWGRVRRNVEASQANAQASAADLAAVRLSAQAGLADAYFQLRVLDAQKDLLEATTDVYRKALEITKSRYTAGVITRVDVLQAETQLKSTEAQTIDLGVQRARLEHAIALLIGKPPAAFSLAPKSLTTTIPEIPAGLPSELLERRPDIAAAERSMASANAQIGVARAAFYPTVQISATAGFSASSLANLLEWPSRFWSIGPLASTPLYDGGLRDAQTEQALAAYDASVASYRETVLKAFQEVEDNLSALRILENEAAVQTQAVDGAQQVVEITNNQYQSGSVPYLNVLIAQSTALANQNTALNILGRRLSASVLLVKALGGDWNDVSSHRSQTVN